METVTEIIAFSHGGSRRLWHPFSAKFGPCCNVICSESMHQSVDLVDTFQMMFTTNNHNPELLEQRNSRMVRRLLFGNNPMKVECSVSFKTEGNEYVLNAKEGQIDLNNDKVIFLKGVEATITLASDEIINIETDNQFKLEINKSKIENYLIMD